MNCRTLCTMGGIGLLLFVFTTSGQADPWGNTPDWISSDTEFTMSVALVDLDNDGDLDLVAGNYKYPYKWTTSPHELQEGDIGAHLVVYEWLDELQEPEFSNAIDLTTTHRCIDCIAIGDYDHDGDMDIAMGLVVGKGDDGGAFVLRNKYEELGGIFNTIDELFDEDDEDYYWYSADPGVDPLSGSYDCHCVRWVDYDCDGYLDLAALEIPGMVHIYRNVLGELGPTTPFEPALTLDLFPDPPGSGQGSSSQGRDNGLSDIPIDYPSRGTTMEFGDMDMDGDLDLFVNVEKLPKVFDNTGSDPYYDKDTYWTIDESWWRSHYNKYNEDQTSASFGFFYGVEDRLALAIGSMCFAGDENDIRRFSPWRNDIYTFENEVLLHQWQSEEYMHADNRTQLVTDIQWARIGGEEDMDLVTASYPVYVKNEDNSGGWERGREQYYEDPYYPSVDPPTYQEWTWASDSIDLSTGLALGDIEYGESYCVETEGERDRRLLYVDNFPFVRLAFIKFRDENITYSEWNPDESTWDFDACYDPMNGWISIDEEYPTPQSADRIEYKYYYGSELDLAVGNDGQNVVYYYGEYGGGYTPEPTHEVIELNTDHVYVESNYIPYPNEDVNLMAPDAIGAGFNGPGQGTYSSTHEDIKDYLDNYTCFKRVIVGAYWTNIELFQGHYFWDFVDKNFDAVEDPDRRGALFSGGHPLWTMGNWDVTVADEDDPMNRPSDQRLNTMWVRNIVNRYRPGGVYASCSGAGWGDWGVSLFRFENEPDCQNYNYFNDPIPSSDDQAIIDLAEKMYRQYQMIKQISFNAYGEDNRDSLEVISPNWGVHFPYEYDDLQVPDGFFALPPMPYLHALNEVDLDIIPGSTDHIFWNYTDYICQQMHCLSYYGEFPEQYADLVDPFNSTIVQGNSSLRVGIEHNFWGYYTPGLREYIYENCNEWPVANWYPVMENGPEHPFFVSAFIFFMDPNWGPPNPGDPKAHWSAAEIAELFSIDVFPEEDYDHLLLKYSLTAAPAAWESYVSWTHETCADLLNKEGIEFHQYDDEVGPAGEPTVYRYTYRVGDTDEYIHFMKTEWDLDAAPEDLYVTSEEWDFELLNNDYSNNDKIDCSTPIGAEFQKNVSRMDDPPYITFAPGEMGPGMLIIHELDVPCSQQDYSQTLQLHPRWNLVSWHLDIEDPDPIGTPTLRISEVLGYDPIFDDKFPRPPEESPNQIWWYDNIFLYYPDEDYDWILTDAYYFNFNQSYAWTFPEDRFPQITIEGYSIDPDPAWDLDVSAPWEEPWEDPLAENWYFICYPVPGYTKVATIYNTHPPSGDNISYKGPFHYLVWDEVDPSQHLAGQYLTIVKSDKGKVYIPYNPPRVPHEIDTLEILEPGKGYFLGFRSDSEITFEGWEDYPGWPTEGISPDPKSPEKQVASANHFQFEKYTHWSYPVIIDTFAIEGIELEQGDEFGILTPEGLCVGAATYTGGFPLVIATWADDIATPDVVDGYQDGDEMTMVLYDVSANEEIIIDLGPQTAAVFDDPIAPRYGGFNQGFYALKSLTRGIKSVQSLPLEYSMGQNYPNPFNAGTVIPLELPQRSKVRIELFDVMGRNLGTIYEGIREAGWPRIRYDASNLASGVYFYRISSEGLERGGQFQDVGKMLLLK